MKKPSLLSGFAFGLLSLALSPALPLAHAAAPAAVDGPAATPEDYDAIQTRAKATHGAYHEIVPDDSFLADANAEARSAAAWPDRPWRRPRRAAPTLQASSTACMTSRRTPATAHATPVG